MAQVEGAGAVLGNDLDPVAVPREFVAKGHRLGVPATVDEPPVEVLLIGVRDHREDRGDPDATGDEQVSSRLDERKVVAW